jgi:long-chain alkane monooxygenase
LLVPELQKRDAYATAYRPGTLREKLFGDGPYLPATHPANAYRDIQAVKRRDAELAAPLRKSAGV